MTKGSMKSRMSKNENSIRVKDEDQIIEDKAKMDDS